LAKFRQWEKNAGHISEGRGRKERASVFVFIFIFRNFCFATKVANLIIGRKMAKKWPSEDLAKI
jgi:hypothetical protein